MGDLEYQYDADSRVIQKTGSFAQTKLPVAVTGNTFNAANEMTAFNGTPQTYDGNGNLTNDGTNTYRGTLETILWESRLKAQFGNTGPYNRYSNSCRTYSQTEFKKIERRIEAGRKRQFGLPLF